MADATLPTDSDRRHPEREDAPSEPGLAAVEDDPRPHGPHGGHGWRGSLPASFGYAFRGLWVLLTTQRNARLHAVATVVVVPLAAWLGLGLLEWVALVLAIGLVWTAEAMNTAIEFLTDAFCPQHHPIAGQAKDVAAAAVLLASITAVVVGLSLFLPRLWAMLAG